MGQRGPAPTPTALLRARGSRLGRERQEPTPQRGIPACPKSLKGPHRKLWTSLCQMLDEVGVLTVIDGTQLERYCHYLIDWRRCQEALDSFGGKALRIAAYSGDASRQVIKGLRAERRELEAFLRHIEANFGLTPSARARLVAPPGEAGASVDPFAAMMEAHPN